MKHAGALLLAVIPLPSPSRSAPGQSSPARLIVNGQDVSLAASPIVHNGVLMVPVPGIFEPFGSSAVWLPDGKAVGISNRTRAVLRLRINDPYALMGTDQRLLPIAPVVLRDIPFIPAQAIFGLLGAWVKFDEEENALRVSSVLSGVTVQRPGGMLRLIARATGPLQAETRQLTNPDRMVIDLRNAVFRLPDQDTPVNDAGVARIRIAQFQAKPPITRVVLDLTQPVDVRVADSTTSFDLTIEVRPRGQAVRAPGAPCRPRSGRAPPGSDARAFVCRRSRNGSPSGAGAEPHRSERRRGRPEDHAGACGARERRDPRHRRGHGHDAVRGPRVRRT